MQISIIVPVLNEAPSIVESLKRLQAMRKLGHEVILVDGGSKDQTIPLATPWVDSIHRSDTGRARQMMVGASKAKGELLLFLHADTCLPAAAESLLTEACSRGDWGRFDLRLSGRHWLFPVIAWFINHRSRWSGVATGDQAIFVRRTLFEAVGGFADIPLMEDIELSKRLKRVVAPVCIGIPLITSSRRWESHGVFKTIVLMWKLRLLYFLGVSPRSIARQYRNHD
ncbi:TIGR04283 family arsenosugar biosynthesis glycosyltransferase [Aestuariirhabdus sp. LZHN29]|uniref:TIGR04283 family arsenosugar biosynthesis glycosyltransferase n=1 Tax=Aestuariirhabdus sp. LZHN29 TaxID=3417462 RepID=UPI003CEFCD33